VTTSEPATLLETLWRDYTASTPQAERIRQLLVDRGEIVHNDHVALRTYDAPGIGITALARPFEARGWIGREYYRFDAKHLRARYWQHPDPNLPSCRRRRARSSMASSPSCPPTSASAKTCRAPGARGRSRTRTIRSCSPRVNTPRGSPRSASA
jgi:hypothetical protein